MSYSPLFGLDAILQRLLVHEQLLTKFPSSSSQPSYMEPLYDISVYDYDSLPYIFQPHFSSDNFHHPHTNFGHNSTGEPTGNFPTFNCSMNSNGSSGPSTSHSPKRSCCNDSSSDAGCASTTSDGSQKQSSFVSPPWSWSLGEPGPSYSRSPFGGILDSPVVSKHTGLQTQTPPSPPTSQPTMTRHLPPTDHDSAYMDYTSSPPSGGLLSPLSLSHRLESDHLDSFRYKDGYHASRDGHPYANDVPLEGPTGYSVDDEHRFPMPFSWHSPCKRILSSPFTDDSDSDDGLSASTFSSPETNSDPGEVEEDEGDHSHHSAYFSPPSTSDKILRYHSIDPYPEHDFYHPTHDDDDDGLLSLPLSFSSTSPPLSPLATSPSLPDLDLGPHEQEQQAPATTTTVEGSPLLSWGIDDQHDVDIQSPSLPLAPLPLFDSFQSFPYDDMSAIPGSPSRRRSKDLPTSETESSSSFGFGFAPFSSSSLIPSSFDSDVVDPYDGPAQRTTWLSLPGADTDDDLIPADLASKNYIPEPGLAIQTTPSCRSLLIWDPTTTTGLPAHLPVFDGTSRRRSMDLNDLPHPTRSPSPDETFYVDPSIIAELVEKDEKTGEEVQKLYDLRQRTTMAATATALAGRNREGTQWEAERVKERWRELTALLRLKLRLDETAGTGKTEGVDARDDGKVQPETSLPAELDSPLSSSESLVLPVADTASVLTDTPRRVSSLPMTTSGSTTSLTPSAAPSPLLSTPATLPQTQQSQRRSSSKQPKITSMAQLVATMVFHRQQDALRRSPVRNRTWPAPSCATLSSGSGPKGKLMSHVTPKSPLRQMILPEDVNMDSSGDAVEGGDGSGKIEDGTSPLQLSPLCLGMCASPESFFAQLDGPHANSSASLQ